MSDIKTNKRWNFLTYRNEIKGYLASLLYRGILKY